MNSFLTEVIPVHYQCMYSNSLIPRLSLCTNEKSKGKGFMDTRSVAKAFIADRTGLGSTMPHYLAVWQAIFRAYI